MEGKLAGLVETVGTYSKETSDFIGKCRASMDEVSGMADGYTKVIEKMEGSVKDLEKKIVNLTDAAQRLHEQSVKENEVMERKRTDIKIYKSRLEKYFKEYLPGQRIDL
jgi:predicted  nucleic acid-binding Zn-ribbon protein